MSEGCRPRSEDDDGVVFHTLRSNDYCAL